MLFVLQTYGKTTSRTPRGESRNHQRRHDQYGRQSHGSRDYPLEVVQNPVDSALGQRPKRSPRSSRSQTHYNPWGMDECSDLSHLRPKRLHVNVTNTPASSVNANHKNLADHIINNMSSNKGPSQQQQPSDTNFHGKQILAESYYRENDSVGNFPPCYSDVRVRDRLKRESTDVFSAPDDSKQEVTEADMYEDDLAQCDSDVIIESSEEDADEN